MTPMPRASADKTSSKRKSYKQRYSECGSREYVPSNKTFFTSFTNRIKYKMHLSHVEAKDPLNLEFVTKLVGPTWNLYKVSPLNNVKYDEVQRKWYAQCIKRELVNHVVDDTKNVQFNAKVSLIHDNEEDPTYPSILEIQVTVKKDDNDERLKYKGILLPANVENDYNLTFAPLLVCIGTVNVTRIVHQALSQLFDTIISPLKIASEDLKWLSVLVCDISMKDSAKAHFDYEPVNTKVKYPLQISLPSSVVKELWNNVHKPESDEVMYEEIVEFYKYLNWQLRIICGINFERLVLKRFRFSNVTVSCDGKLQIHSAATVDKVCTFLKQLALVLETPTPSLSVSVDS